MCRHPLTKQSCGHRLLPPASCGWIIRIPTRCKIFSTIDLANAYYQLPPQGDSRDLTAFITHDGLFRFFGVPYGLASASSAFQKMKDWPCCLRQHPWWTWPEPQHCPPKTDWGWTTVSLQEALSTLLHVITADSILPDQEHIDGGLKAPPASDIAALRSFLDLVSWHSKVLPNFAQQWWPLCVHVSRTKTPLHGLLQHKPALRKSSNSLWTVLHLLCLILLYTWWYPDASDYGLGCLCISTAWWYRETCHFCFSHTDCNRVKIFYKWKRRTCLCVGCR